MTAGAAGQGVGPASLRPAPVRPIEGLPFTAPALLAPMEGVTDPCFRDLLFARQGPAHLGGATTEFLRVVDHARGARQIEASLGPRRWPQPVALQLMGNHGPAMADTARRARDLGVPLIDLNFGCPAKGALRSCAGSALLARPAELEALVRTVAAAVPELPVSAKLRAGVDHARDVESLVRAAEAGGARLVTLHCRTRQEGYCEEVDWQRLARAAAAVRVPVCGNGGVASHGDLERLRRETGCALVMVGRAALADPWIFSGESVPRERAAEFLLEYWATLIERGGAGPSGALARSKQLFHFFRAGGLIQDQRSAWLRARDPDSVHSTLARIAAGSPETHPPAA